MTPIPPSHPATTRDLRELEERIDRKFEFFTDEIKRHFDVCVEQIRHDLLGANHDEIELLKDARLDHDRRIQTLEARV